MSQRRVISRCRANLCPNEELLVDVANMASPNAYRTSVSVDTVDLGVGVVCGERGLFIEGWVVVIYGVVVLVVEEN